MRWWLSKAQTKPSAPEAGGSFEDAVRRNLLLARLEESHRLGPQELGVAVQLRSLVLLRRDGDRLYQSS
jgi:hypothetical protein